MDSSATWYLMKNDDGSVFGPISLDQLKEWAYSAQISPLDKVSTDEATWSKAPTVPELEMDYLLQMDDEHFYGPTTVGAVREFLNAGEINRETIIINCKDNTQRKIGEFPLLNLEEEIAPSQDAPVPGKTNIRQSLQARIRQLEEMLMEERKSYKAMEDRLHKLEAAYLKATGHEF